ncbi:hypothetical protein IQ254_09550 [Nodosilinea sp. LEGE 07088]|uniref:hypothetical protein n=1 Tax=Nodosilinea sp. LEGE 07088 TaxID=2777968 RepID=UPI00187E6C4C|nr:hypothetical protein [Nodosilinea sp. LEGE 07088]MBE9137452.1 hypothetical protein [Nodosilinea sp. LEGE 07088]
MTQSSDRLDRVEALLATVAESQARTQIIVEQNAAGLRETRAIADSNARAIEAWSTRIEDGIAEAEEVSSSIAANTNTRMEQAIADTVQMIANLGQQQQETDQRFNNLLEEARADRQRAEQHKAEADQRFETFLAEARADRAEMRAAREQWQLEAQANATEHRAFTQNIQVLLAEIARLWQRVAG